MFVWVSNSLYSWDILVSLQEPALLQFPPNFPVDHEAISILTGGDLNASQSCVSSENNSTHRTPVIMLHSLMDFYHTYTHVCIPEIIEIFSWFPPPQNYATQLPTSSDLMTSSQFSDFSTQQDLYFLLRIPASCSIAQNVSPVRTT